MNPIETKEIRGISLRSLYALISSTVAIVVTVLLAFSSLESRINELILLRTEQTKYDDLRIRTLDLRVQSLEMEFKEFKKTSSIDQN